MNTTEHLMSTESNSKRLKESMVQVDELRQKRAERDNPDLPAAFIKEALEVKDEMGW